MFIKLVSDMVWKSVGSRAVLKGEVLLLPEQARTRRLRWLGCAGALADASAVRLLEQPSPRRQRVCSGNGLTGFR